MLQPLDQQDLELVLRGTAPLWEEVRGRRFFVTGGTGFFGCWLIESFCYINRHLQLDSAVSILTRDPDAFARKCPHLVRDSSITLLAGDVRTFSFPEGEFDYVIHAATEARARQAENQPLEMLSTILAGTERTLEFAASHGVKKFLLTSSGAVYGKQPSELTHVPETFSGAPDSLQPASVYGEGKRVSELLCALYQKRSAMQCKIARCWAFCGPHLPLYEHFAIGNFIGDILAGKPIQILGDGTPRRSYLYAADLTIWLWTILFRAPALEPFNVGSQRDLSILELAHLVATVLKPGTEIHVSQSAPANTLPNRYVPAVEHAHETLNLKETVLLEEAIVRTARWHGFFA